MRMERCTGWRVPVAEQGRQHNHLRRLWPLTMALAASAKAVATTIVLVLIVLAMALWRRGGGRWVCWRQVVPRQWRQLFAHGTRGCTPAECDACFIEPNTVAQASPPGVKGGTVPLPDVGVWSLRAARTRDLLSTSPHGGWESVRVQSRCRAQR